MKLLLIVLLAMSSTGILVYNISNKLLVNKTTKLDKEYNYSEEEPMYIEVPQVPCETCVSVVSSGEENNLGSPILDVNVYKESKLISSFIAISGRAEAQSLDRNIANNSSPAPNGNYTIKKETVGYEKETGGVFLPFEPNFTTQRTDLGAHIDPSWGINNGENGTEGCIAFKDLESYNNFTKLIVDNKIFELNINY